MARTTAQIQSEITAKFGFIPPFFEPAFDEPILFENLWQQTLTGYVENPLPDLFKEKLAALLARYCTVPYCLLCHSSALRPLGMSASAMLEMLEQAPLSYEELSEKTNCLKTEPLTQWPEEGSHLEECILFCAVAIYLGEDTEDCQNKLRSLLPKKLYDYLILYIAYNKTALTWAEAHPELNFENDRRVQENYEPLIGEDPKLADFFKNYRGRVATQSARRAQWLTSENRALIEQERELRSSIESEKNRLLRVFEHMPGPVAMLSGPQHVFTYANNQYCDLFLGGKNPVGKTVAQALPDAIEQGFGDLLDTVFSTGQRYFGKDAAIDIAQPDGKRKTFYLNFVYEPVRNLKNEIEGILAAVTDVTETKTAELALSTERRKLEFMIQEAPVGIALLEGQPLKFSIVNSRWRALVPGQRSYSGRTYEEAYPEYTSYGFSRLIDQVYETGESYSANEMKINTREGQDPAFDRFYDFSYIRITDVTGKPTGVFSMASDVTERVTTQRQLALAKQEAEKSNELKSAFLANMSHEIRTPLGAMLGFADLMRDLNITPSERSNYINILLRNGEQLSVIINDILDLSKVESGQLTLEYTATDHTKIGSEVVSLMQVKAKEKDLALEYSADMSAPDIIISDPTRVRQILLNLVGNAIKFTQFGSVRIRTYGCKTDTGMPALCFEVTDTGIGITPAQQERLFQTFSQADETTTRKFGGTGLGLALSRRLARSLGGDVTISRSEPGVGTTFLVKIADQPDLRSRPEDTFKVEVRTKPEIKEKSLEGLKILVVDDAPDNQQLIWRYLTKQGASVVSAENGLFGYRAALSGDFDLVLMDIQMPVMDGYTATQKLREAGYTKPIIALTAHAMNEIRKKALNVGYTDHLTKPINPADLISTIVRYTAPGH